MELGIRSVLRLLDTLLMHPKLLSVTVNFNDDGLVGGPHPSRSALLIAVSFRAIAVVLSSSDSNFGRLSCGIQGASARHRIRDQCSLRRLQKLRSTAIAEVPESIGRW